MTGPRTARLVFATLLPSSMLMIGPLFQTKSTLSPLGSKDTATIEMEPRGQCFDSERQIEDGKTANILPGR
jgi:hypothetical protein